MEFDEYDSAFAALADHEKLEIVIGELEFQTQNIIDFGEFDDDEYSDI